MRRLKEELINEIDEFRENGKNFLNGNISKMEFKHISGGFGVYAERSQKTFVIRLRIPSGIADVEELRWVCKKSRRMWFGKNTFDYKRSYSASQSFYR